MSLKRSGDYLRKLYDISKLVNGKTRDLYGPIIGDVDQNQIFSKIDSPHKTVYNSENDSPIHINPVMIPMAFRGY